MECCLDLLWHLDVLLDEDLQTRILAHDVQVVPAHVIDAVLRVLRVI